MITVPYDQASTFLNVTGVSTIRNTPITQKTSFHYIWTVLSANLNMDIGSGDGGGTGSSGVADTESSDGDGTGSSDGTVDSQNQALELQSQVLVQNQILNLVHLHQSLYLGHYNLESSHSSSSFNCSVEFMCFWVKVLGYLSCHLRI